MNSKKTKQHLRRHGWIYLLAAFAVLFPVYVVRSHRLPPADPDSVRTLVAWIDSDLTTRYGPPRWSEFVKRFPAREGRFAGYQIENGGNVSVYLKLGPILSATNPVLDGFEQSLRENLDAWDELAPTGRFATSAADMLDWGTTGAQMTPNFLDIQIQIRLRVALAIRDVARGDWDTALSELHRAGHATDPLRGGLLISTLIAIAGRGITYGGYQVLLSQDPPADVCRRALDDLVEMADTEPVFDPLIYLTETTGWIGMALPDASQRYRQGPVETNLGRLMGLSYASIYAASQSDSRYARFRLLPLAEFDQHSPLPIAMMKTLTADWTAAPAIKAWLLQTAEEHPEVLDLPGVPAEVEAKLDFWTRVYAVGVARQMENNAGMNVGIRLAVGSSYGYVLRIGFAARLYQLEHGAWPERMEQIVPAYLPADTREAIFTPVHMSRRTVDDGLRKTLWQEFLPQLAFGGRWAEAVEPYLSGNRLEWTGSGVNRLRIQPIVPEVDPSQVYAVAETLRHYPQLVESVEVQVQRVPGGEFEPLTAPWPESASPPNAIYFRAELTAPKEVFAIWSAGPDGDDDGGQMPYDPTNGINSNGDIVQFLWK